MSEPRVHRNWLETYIEYTKEQESPTMFHLWTGISIIAGALRRNVYLDRGYYKLYPNMFIVLVAPTGRCRKSTAATIGKNLLLQIDGHKILHEKITPEGLIVWMAKEEVVVEKTVDMEKKEKVKYNTTCHAYIFAPELSVFLSSQSYNSGLIELLTTLYDPKDDWDYKTKTQGEIKLKNSCLNLLGASNPEWLAKGLGEDSFGGGFMGRTIFISQTEGKKVAWPRPSDAQRAQALTLVIDLQKIAKIRGQFEVEKEALDFYTDWYNNYKADFKGRMAGYEERKQEHILKLAMIVAVAESDKLLITKRHIEMALKLLEEAEKNMSSAFSFVGATSEAVVAHRILEHIRDVGGAIERTVLLQTFKHSIRNVREFDEVVRMLEESGLVVKYAKNNGEKFLMLKYMYDDIIRSAALLTAKAKEELDNENKIKEQVKEAINAK